MLRVHFLLVLYLSNVSAVPVNFINNEDFHGIDRPNGEHPIVGHQNEGQHDIDPGQSLDPVNRKQSIEEQQEGYPVTRNQNQDLELGHDHREPSVEIQSGDQHGIDPITGDRNQDQSLDHIQHHSEKPVRGGIDVFSNDGNGTWEESRGHNPHINKGADRDLVFPDSRQGQPNRPDLDYHDNETLHGDTDFIAPEPDSHDKEIVVTEEPLGQFTESVRLLPDTHGGEEQLPSHGEAWQENRPGIDHVTESTRLLPDSGKESPIQSVDTTARMESHQGGIDEEQREHIRHLPQVTEGEVLPPDTVMTTARVDREEHWEPEPPGGGRPEQGEELPKPVATEGHRHLPFDQGGVTFHPEPTEGRKQLPFDQGGVTFYPESTEGRKHLPSERVTIVSKSTDSEKHLPFEQGGVTLKWEVTDKEIVVVSKEVVEAEVTESVPSIGKPTQQTEVSEEGRPFPDGGEETGLTTPAKYEIPQTEQPQTAENFMTQSPEITEVQQISSTIQSVGMDNVTPENPENAGPESKKEITEPTEESLATTRGSLEYTTISPEENFTDSTGMFNGQSVKVENGNQDENKTVEKATPKPSGKDILTTPYNSLLTESVTIQPTSSSSVSEILTSSIDSSVSEILTGSIDSSVSEILTGSIDSSVSEILTGSIDSSVSEILTSSIDSSVSGSTVDVYQLSTMSTDHTPALSLVTTSMLHQSTDVTSTALKCVDCISTETSQTNADISSGYTESSQGALGFTTTDTQPTHISMHISSAIYIGHTGTLSSANDISPSAHHGHMPGTSVNIAASTTPPQLTTSLSVLLYVNVDMKMSLHEFCVLRSHFIQDLAMIPTLKAQKQLSKKQIMVQYPGQDDCDQKNEDEKEEVNIHLYVLDNSGQLDISMTLDMAKNINSESISREFGCKLGPVKVVQQPDRQGKPQNESPSLIKEEERIETGIVIAISIAAVGGFCCVCLLVLQIVMHRRSGKKMHSYFLGGSNYSSRLSTRSLNSIALDDVSKKSRPNSGLWNPGLDLEDEKCRDPSHPLVYSSLVDFACETEAIHQEFQRIPNETPRLSCVPVGAEEKNRFANVLPFPHSRVRLRKISGEDCSDYINANYITGYKEDLRAYIATQAPLTSTAADFWRMVWEQQCKVVLMLTDMDERGKPRCIPYWPEKTGMENRLIYGDYCIILKKKEVHQEYIVSVLDIKDIARNLVREVRHFWYTCWPSDSSPEPISLVKFVLDTRPHYEDSGAPVIIHCCPGTGRTGTLIAIDICMRSFEDKRSVNILNTVYKMRKERAGAVQTKEQYQLIYKAVCEYAVVMNTPTSVSTSSSVATLTNIL